MTTYSEARELLISFYYNGDLSHDQANPILEVLDRLHGIAEQYDEQLTEWIDDLGCDAGNFDGGSSANCEHCNYVRTRERLRGGETFRSLAGMVYTECPCGCGSKEICEEQAARVKANDDAIPF